ncbi:AsmA family protein [Alkalilacustris brevis]|uniref:AsmA family protein n=1 Tax=Alkalilacustris brevis TaxID=2026338 RepID=UPI000E0D34CE|nr:AsmA family protein [Alkalilacustris brevis]
MRWIFRTLGALVVFAVLGTGALLLIPGERIASLAAQQFEAATGRTLEFSGEVQPTLWPVVGAVSGPVRLANADWSDEGPMLEAEGLEIGLDALALMRGELAIRNIRAVAPRIVLERATDGRENWNFGDVGGAAADPAGGTPSAAFSGRGFTLDRAEIEDGALVFIDHGAGMRLSLSALNAAMSLPDPAGPASLVASGQLGREAFAIDTRVEGLARALDGAVVPLRVALEAAGSSLSFDGRAGSTPLSVDGPLELALADPARLFAMFGLPAPDLPPELAGGVQASGRVTLTGEGALYLRGAALSLAGVALEALDLDLTPPAEASGPARLVASGRLDGQALSLDGQSGALDAALSGAQGPLALTVRLGENRLRFDGRAGHAPLAAEGRIEANVADLPRLLRSVGQPAPDLPPALRAPLAATGQLRYGADGTASLSDAAISLGSNRLNGQLVFVPGGERPRLTGSLSGGALDFSGFLTPAAPGGAGADGQAQGWPTDSIDASALGLFDANLNLAAQSVNLGEVQLGATRLNFALDRARAVTTLHEMRIYDGNLTGEFVVNNRSGLSMGGELRLADAALLPLLRDTADFERLSGRASGQLNFLAVGNSVDALLRRLSGQGRIEFGQGEIIGLDLAGMLRNLDLSYMGEGNRTIYDSVTGSFTIADGVLSNSDLRMDARRVTVDGRGTVDIGRQQLNYRVTPRAFTGDEGSGLRVPLLIAGAWAAPRVRLDLEALAEERLRLEREDLEQRAREEAARAEHRAREAAEQAIRDRIGVEVEEGESAEDALRRRFEREIERSLRGLLGGN